MTCTNMWLPVILSFTKYCKTVVQNKSQLNLYILLISWYTAAPTLQQETVTTHYGTSSRHLAESGHLECNKN